MGGAHDAIPGHKARRSCREPGLNKCTPIRRNRGKPGQSGRSRTMTFRSSPGVLLPAPHKPLESRGPYISTVCGGEPATAFRAPAAVRQAAQIKAAMQARSTISIHREAGASDCVSPSNFTPDQQHKQENNYPQPHPRRRETGRKKATSPDDEHHANPPGHNEPSMPSESVWKRIRTAEHRFDLRHHSAFAYFRPSSSCQRAYNVATRPCVSAISLPSSATFR